MTKKDRKATKEYKLRSEARRVARLRRERLNPIQRPSMSRVIINPLAGIGA